MKRLLLVFTMLACILSLASCSFSGKESHNGEVAIFYSDEKNEYVSGVKKELEALFDGSGVKYTAYNAKGSEDSMEKQIEDAVKSGAKALIVDVNEDDVSEHAAEIAMQKDIPVVFFGTNVENETDGYKKAAFVEVERRDVDTDFEGSAKTIVKILDNLVKGEGRFKDIDDTYHDGYMTVYVPSLQ
ncbi:MAG: substrate-binding domain-containing protein [Clostridia bacterium]|nr:substrate-binding domain-containing protein [Clostridia bacterium]